jgi:hypothetical protein
MRASGKLVDIRRARRCVSRGSSVSAAGEGISPLACRRLQSSRPGRLVVRPSTITCSRRACSQLGARAGSPGRGGAHAGWVVRASSSMERHRSGGGARRDGGIGFVAAGVRGAGGTSGSTTSPVAWPPRERGGVPFDRDHPNSSWFVNVHGYCPYLRRPRLSRATTCHPRPGRRLGSPALTSSGLTGRVGVPSLGISGEACRLPAPQRRQRPLPSRLRPPVRLDPGSLS